MRNAFEATEQLPNKTATPNGLGDRSANPATIWEPGRSRVHLHFLRGARTETDCAPGGADDAANLAPRRTPSVISLRSGANAARAAAERLLSWARRRKGLRYGLCMPTGQPTTLSCV